MAEAFPFGAKTSVFKVAGLVDHGVRGAVRPRAEGQDPGPGDQCRELALLHLLGVCRGEGDDPAEDGNPGGEGDDPGKRGNPGGECDDPGKRGTPAGEGDDPAEDGDPAEGGDPAEDGDAILS